MPHKPSPKTTQSSTPTPEKCPQCHEFIGRNYPQCSSCLQATEQPIKTAWQSLLQAQHITLGTPAEQQLATTVLAHSDTYWWSEVEAAMRLTSCSSCNGPLGYGSPTCAECISSSDMLWGKDLDIAPEGTIRRNEHALRVILRGLAQSHRHSQASIDGWRLYLPFVLRGSHPGSTPHDIRHAQAIRAWINAGRGSELFNCNSIEEMYALTRQGRK